RRGARASRRARTRSSPSSVCASSAPRSRAPRKWSCIGWRAVRYDRVMRRRALLLVVVGLVAFGLVAVLPTRVDAEIYKWVDDNGVPHFADGIHSVPDRYRSRAAPVGLKNEPAAATGASTSKPGPSGGTTIN